MSSHYVYAIVNKINLKLYFGSHSWDGEGLDPNYYGSGKIIKQAVNKYGKDNFIVYPIKFYNSVEECRKAEEELLTKYDISNNPYCYNLKNSAMGGDKGRKLSEDTKRKMSQAQKGRTFSEESRKKMSQAQKGKKHTEESRKKMSQAHKGKTLSEETRKKMSQAQKGKTVSEESRKKISQALKGKTVSEESRKKMSQASKGRTFSEETRKKLSQAQKGKTLSEETRKKLSQAQKGKKHTDETRKKISQAMKRVAASEEYRKKVSKAMKGRTLSDEHRQKIVQSRKNLMTPIVAIQIDTGKVKIFVSQNECSRVLGVNLGSINNCLKGKIKQTGGYTFKYVEELESGIYEGFTEGIAE